MPPARNGGLAVVAASLLALAFARPACAQTAPPLPQPADCSVLDAAVAGRILGYPVGAPEETSRAGGVCFYASRSLTQEGVLSYAVVTPERVAQRRALYAVFTRRCAGVVAAAPRAALCDSYRKLSEAKDVDAAYAAATGAPDATEVPGLGSHAVATANALYVRRSKSYLEVVVRRGDAFDLDRAVAAAKYLLQRLGR